ncbi:MAG: NAD(P)/FAD-dependent oxidoreductase [Ramlibacter sp.]|nr:NAD(P)/FAD-dependent oxidoreductase [Ramlibacter sp.]
MNTTEHIEADYVIVGAGATGMAFADELLTCSDATMAIVDRRHAPGGHWNDAYPFVRLHGPSQHYGVNSRPLGAGGIEAQGLNRGLPERASAAAVRDHFDQVLRERLLPSGRVRYLPMHDWRPDPSEPMQGAAISRVGGRRLSLRARRRIVDATRADTQLPGTHAPPFHVAQSARWVTPGELTTLREPASGYTVVGAGKTAMDTVLWLLEQGVASEAIRWVRPREAWLLNRADLQPRWESFPRALAAQVLQIEAAAEATSVDQLFLVLEAGGLMMRIDRQVQPTMFRCALVSEHELHELRRIRQVIRAGHVRALEPERVVLDRGVLPLPAGHLVVHCAANGIPARPPEPAFQGPRLVLHFVRRCAPSFSAALLARLEAAPLEDEHRNAMSHPVPAPEVPADWLRMQLQEAGNERGWRELPDLAAWLGSARLAGFSTLMARAARERTPEIDTLLSRMRQALEPGLVNMARMLKVGAEEESRRAARTAAPIVEAA